ncbi:DNA polymerase III subunit gamma/tau [Candidatus Phytoplasma prunorum]|uniref:DNA polymerase III subunit gamma/tau n=1 Tax=Candidatus Phytoplasma prunorum TaxID=47565 RepID=UPI002FF2B724
MSYIVFYRKYRPKFFKNVVGQKIIIQTLRNAIIYKKLSHCYLFSGNKGTGKTTLAKIFSKTINCLNNKDGECCGYCDSCIITDKQNSDIIEIDGASYNGIEEIRELKSKINYKANFLKYKIYIIDEVHVLTGNAFNALLKILEEPPKHVIFIFATTESNKIPETILSRAQHFHFLNITKKNIIEKLKEVINLEKISIENEALEKIAIYSQGSLRDALNLLDQISSYQTDLITVKCVQEIKGIVEKSILIKLLKYMFNKDLKSIIDLLFKINNEGKNILILFNDLIIILKNCLLEELLSTNDQKIKLENFSLELANYFLKTLIDYKQNLKNSDSKESFLEIIFIQMLSSKNLKNNENKFFFNYKQNIESSQSLSLQREKYQKKIFDILFHSDESKKQLISNAWYKLKSYKNNTLQKAANFLFKGKLIAVGFNNEMLLVYEEPEILENVKQKDIKKQILTILNSKKNIIKGFIAILEKNWNLYETYYLKHKNKIISHPNKNSIKNKENLINKKININDELILNKENFKNNKNFYEEENNLSNKFLNNEKKINNKTLIKNKSFLSLIEKLFDKDLIEIKEEMD